ncbi:tetratricopeptide repeat protein [Microcoleus sp. ZQ-A2]
MAPRIAQQPANSDAAQQVLQEGIQLFQRGTAESLRQAIPKFERAAILYHQAGNKRSEALSLGYIGYIYNSLGEKQKALELFNQALPLFRAVGDRGVEASTLNGIGSVYDSLGEKQKALEYYNQALPLFRAVGDRGGEAATLDGIGSVYDSLGEMQKALEFYDQALPLRRAVGDRGGEATTLANIGLVYDSLGEKQKALEYYNQALPLFRAVGDRGGEATTLNNIGSVYDSLGEMQKALEFYDQALPLRRAVGDRGGEATTLANIGLVYDSLGEMQKALEYYNQALPLLRAVGDRGGEATTLNNIGSVYNSLGEKQKALEFYNQALPLLRAVGDRGGEAATLNNIGSVYDSLGEMQKALEYYNQALPLRRAVGDRGGEATTLANIGLVYDSLGEMQKALEYYNQALPLRRAVGDRGGEAVTLNNIGSVYNSLGEKQKALEFYNQALPLLRAVGDRGVEATTLNNVGGVFDSLGEPQKALEFYNQALLLSRAVGDRGGEAVTLTNIGSVYDDLGEKQKALEFYNQALPLLRAVGDRGGEATTLYNVAFLQRSQGNLKQALTLMENSITIFEDLRTKIGSQELRASYFATVQGYYEFYIDLLMQLHQQNPSQGYDALALHASERARARSLLELLTEANANIRQGVDPKLLEQERTLQQQLNALERRRHELSSSQYTQQQLDEIKQQSQSLLTQLDQLEAQIRVTSPRYAALKYPEPLNLQQIQQQVLDDDTLLLEYSLGKDRSYLWAVSKTSITSYVLPKRSEIEAAAQTFRQSLTPNSAANLETGLPLTQMLLAPVANQLGNKRLLIVGDGALQSVPFAALPIPGNIKMSVSHSSHRDINDSEGFSFLLSPRPEINDTVGELRKGHTPLKINVDVGAKHSGDQFCYSTKIFVSECFALPPSSQGEAFVKINPGLVAKSGHECFAPTESCMRGITPNQFANNIIPRRVADTNASNSYTPLLVQNEIITLPSASTVAIQRRQLHNRPTAAKKLAVVADPIFALNDPRFSTTSQQTPETPTNSALNRATRNLGLGDSAKVLDRLQYTGTEAKKILALVPEKQRLQALDFNASRTTATDPNLAQYQIIHLATHGLLDPINPELSGIVLSLYDQQGKSQDGFLRLHDIFNLNLPAELVVLSACETGLGKDVKGEGLVGLTRGFMYAGSRRVVVSLWSVNDVATSEVMAKFYQKMLQEGQNPVSALRSAQLEMWKSQQWQSPYYWAAFTVQGDWR